MKPSKVVIHQTSPLYPSASPYHPSAVYPEYGFDTSELSAHNAAYDAVREVLHSLDLDNENFGTAAWNPLRSFVRPGDHVMVKPNMISPGHPLTGSWEHVITHPSVVRALVDYVLIALGETTGTVTIADGPQYDSDFELIVARTGLRALEAFYAAHGRHVRVLDLRPLWWPTLGGLPTKRLKLSGDPRGYVEVQLAETSEFSTYKGSGRFYGADYNMAETRRFHDGAHHHAYVLSRSALDADVFINVSKLKTHKKTGVTLSVKNMVGLCGNRNCLPHYTCGTPSGGGDEMPDGLAAGLESRCVQFCKSALARRGGVAGPMWRGAFGLGRWVFGETSEVVRSGNWYGNDTAWRMALDVYKAYLGFDGAGHKRRSPVRYLALVDGLIGGQGDGPLSPDPVPAGVIIAGADSVAVDTVAATLMGYDFRKLPIVSNGWSSRGGSATEGKPSDLTIASNVTAWQGTVENLARSGGFGFIPHFGWQGHVEL
jgi:uncharacterized protein (DUF362 family)